MLTEVYTAYHTQLATQPKGGRSSALLCLRAGAVTVTAALLYACVCKSIFWKLWCRVLCTYLTLCTCGALNIASTLAWVCVGVFFGTQRKAASSHIAGIHAIAIQDTGTVRIGLIYIRKSQTVAC